MNPMSEDLTVWFLDRGVYLRPLGNVLYCTPPYSMKDEELDLIYNSIRELLRKTERPVEVLNV